MWPSCWAAGPVAGSSRQSYLGRRLRDALQQVQRKGSADGLDNELKYLSDLDAARQQDSYGLVRIVIWATPMLGFLGTVIGITQALAIWTPNSWPRTFRHDGVPVGRPVREVDTTAVALSLSTSMMFIQFLMDRVETQLLSTVDIRSNEALVGRFAEIGSGSDPHLASWNV